MTYPPSQKPPIWSIDPGVIAYNCQMAGMPRPVLAMPMWEGAGALARDYSGRGNHGVLTGGQSWVAEGIDFDGANDYITLTNEIVFDDNYTLCALVACDVVFNMFCGRNDSDNYAAVTSQTNIRIQDNANGNKDWTFPTMNLSELYNIIITKDSSNDWRCYLDNTESATGAINADSTFNIDMIGNGYTGTIYAWDGLINGFLIFDSLLNAQQRKFLNYNPYFMYQIPEELYGYVAAAPPTGNPFWYYNMLKRRN